MRNICTVQYYTVESVKGSEAKLEKYKNVEFHSRFWNRGFSVGETEKDNQKALKLKYYRYIDMALIKYMFTYLSSQPINHNFE